MGDTDFAEVQGVGRTDLERVTVDEYDLAVRPDVDVALVHVAEHVASGVQHVKRSGSVASDVEQIVPGSLRLLLLPVRRAVDVVDWLFVRGLGHQEADDRATLDGVQRV